MTITGVKTDHFAPTRTPEGDLHYGHGEAGTHARGRASGGCWKWRSTCWIKQPPGGTQPRTLRSKTAAGAESGFQPRLRQTTLLTETLTRLKGRADCAVIEGDQQTVNDAARIRATGTPAIQVNTGKAAISMPR